MCKFFKEDNLEIFVLFLLVGLFFACFTTDLIIDHMQEPAEVMEVVEVWKGN